MSHTIVDPLLKALETGRKETREINCVAVIKQTLVEEFFGSKLPECYSTNDPMLCPPPDKRVTPPHPGGMGVCFMEKMRENVNKISQINAQTGETMTYGELLMRSIRTAQHLSSRGCTRNDIVALCTYNHMNSCVPFLACLFLGVRVSSLDPTLPPDDSTYLLKLVTPRYMFCTPESEEVMENSIAAAGLPTEIIVFGNTERNTPFSEFILETETEREFEARPVEDIFETAVILFSSGTTGFSKGVCSTHYGLLVQNAYLGLHLDTSACLLYSTLYWISGVNMLTIAMLSGGARVFSNMFDEYTAIKYVEKYKVSYTFMAPAYIYKLTENPVSCNYDTRSLKCVIFGGAPLGEEQILKLRKLLPYTVVSNMYGMTELAGLATMFNLQTELDLIDSKPTSTGKPVPGLSYKIVDPDTEKVLGPNERGELRIKGKSIMSGYHNNPEESAKAFDNEGYLYTGDIAYYDEEYSFYIVDRIKDALKYQSVQVPPAEVEAVILKHPAVKCAVVIGIPDKVDGDHPMGVIVLKPGETITEEEIANFVNERVHDRKKLRAGVKFVDYIPLTPSGKQRRREVRDWVLSGKI